MANPVPIPGPDKAKWDEALKDGSRLADVIREFTRGTFAITRSKVDMIRHLQDQDRRAFPNAVWTEDISYQALLRRLGEEVGSDDLISADQAIRELVKRWLELLDTVESDGVGVCNLLIRGYPANFQDARTGATALHYAATYGLRAALRELVNSRKCDYLIRDKKGRLASELAGTYGEDPAMARLLLKKEKDQARSRGIQIGRREASSGALNSLPRSPSDDRILEGFKVGDAVVHSNHGIGEVKGFEGRETAGASVSFMQVHFPEGRTNRMIPVAQIKQFGMRHLRHANLALLETLKSQSPVKRKILEQLLPQFDAKLEAGQPLAIAEVVRDLHFMRYETPVYQGELYPAAVRRLAKLLATSEEIQEAHATAWIQRMLKKAPSLIAME